MLIGTMYEFLRNMFSVGIKQFLLSVRLKGMNRYQWTIRSIWMENERKVK